MVPVINLSEGRQMHYSTEEIPSPVQRISLSLKTSIRLNGKLTANNSLRQLLLAMSDKKTSADSITTFA